MAEFPQLPDAPQAPQDGQPKVISRDRPDVPPDRADLVKTILKNIETAKAHWQEKFDQMKAEMQFARGKQWPKQTKADERYVADVVMRHIQSRVASIYARNPKVVAKRKPRIEYKIWDGNAETLQNAQMIMQAAIAGQAPPGISALMAVDKAKAILDDAKAAYERIEMMNKLGRTLEIVFQHELDEGVPKFKIQAKQLVRRVKTCGAAVVKLGYQRVMSQSADLASKLKDSSDRLAEMERIAADVADGVVYEGQAEMEQLRLLTKDIQSQQDIVLREGLVFDFPRSYAVFPDAGCIQLKGFVGARFVVQEFMFTPNDVKRVFKVDVGKNYSGFNRLGKMGGGATGKDDYACVYEYYDMETQMVSHVCVGYPDFLTEPKSPETELEQIHPFFVLSFNDVEDDEQIFPPSDVEQMKHIQLERNRSREALREHRIANRPALIGAKGLLGKDDKQKLGTHAVNEYLELEALNPAGGEKVSDKIMAKPTVAIDPAVYTTDHLDDDYLRVTGNQVANIGPTKGGTATESSIAESSRQTTMQSDADDLDEFLTDMARAGGQILLREMSLATVKKIAGEGAVWPEFNRQQLAEEVYLEIKAGSSGRPNKQLDVATTERLAPFVLQTPGFNPAWWVKRLINLLDDTIDPAEAILEGSPSIMAMNGMMQPSTGAFGTDPNAQGPKGGQKTPAPMESQPGPQINVAPPPPPTGPRPGPGGPQPHGRD